MISVSENGVYRPNCMKNRGQDLNVPSISTMSQAAKVHKFVEVENRTIPLLLLVSSQNIKKSFLCVLRGITRNVCTVSARDFGNIPYFFLLSLYIAARQFTTSCEVTWSADGTIPDCTVERMILDGRCYTSSDTFRLQATRNATVDRFETLST